MYILQDVISRIEGAVLGMAMFGSSEEFQKGWVARCRELGEALAEEHNISAENLMEADRNVELGPKSTEKFRELDQFFRTHA